MVMTMMLTMMMMMMMMIMVMMKMQFLIHLLRALGKGAFGRLVLRRERIGQKHSAVNLSLCGQNDLEKGQYSSTTIITSRQVKISPLVSRSTSAKPTLGTKRPNAERFNLVCFSISLQIWFSPAVRIYL